MRTKMQLLVLVCFLAGCVAGEANRYYLKERLPAKKISEVEVLRGEPKKDYVVIADFQASQASFKHMQRRAAEIGADAVIVTPAGGRYSESEIWAEDDRYSDTYTRLIATAIKYKKE